MLGFLIINIAFKLVKNKLNIEDMFCNIKIFNNGKEQRLRAMIDTGNLLKDPITNSPVVIIEKSKLLNILPEEILENTKKIINGQYEFSDEYLKYASKFRVLPFSSLGKQNGMLLGFKVDRIEAEINDEEIIRKDVIIGIYDKKLSNRNQYEGLIGLNYVEKSC
ncbi:MAG: sigma-E processing peptidase SpoIIGA [Clostridia bacterium]|nr:sigma-E processing peptidase SpoIIGA [Clostridia bacterium]